MASCSTKEDTAPSYADTDRMEELIDNSIEAIARFRDDYGTYVLYRFDKTLDFAYQFEQATNWQNATLTTIGRDEAAAAFDMLAANVFCCYGDAYKRELFPRKLLLTASISSSAELGLSVPVGGKHSAVANINSVTFAHMAAQDVAEAMADNSVMTARCNAMHRALLADYLVKARGKYPVTDEYFSYSKTDYASLMSSSRKTAAQLLREDENFFYDRGFFNPEDEESTYFPAAEEDILAFICNMITMDKPTADRMLDMPLMANKMHLITKGLSDMGVDVVAINPVMEQFVKLEHIQPATMYADDVVTDSPEATLEVTIMRGSHSLSHLEVMVGGADAGTIDLKQYGKDRMRIVVPVHLSGLVKGANPVTLRLYEEGYERPASTLNTAVSYASMDAVSGLSIICSTDHEDVYRRIKFSYGDGGSVDDEQNPNLTTIAFEKHGYLDKYFMEQEAEYRYWKVYKEDGHVVRIMAYLQDGFNDDYTAPLYRHTGTYTYMYNEDGELTGVTLTDESGNRQIVADVAYIDGRIVRYTYDGRAYEPAYATAEGVTTRVDCLDAGMKGLRFGFDGTEDLNPYYMPELPAVIPGMVAEIPLQLLYSRYLFKSLEGVWDGGWRRNVADKLNYAEIDYGNGTWTYRFKLK